MVPAVLVFSYWRFLFIVNAYSGEFYFFVFYPENLLKGGLLSSNTASKYFQHNSKVYLKKIWRLKYLLRFRWDLKTSVTKTALADHITSNFLKTVFRKFNLIHSWILCPINSFKILWFFSKDKTDFSSGLSWRKQSYNQKLSFNYKIRSQKPPINGIIDSWAGGK